MVDPKTFYRELDSLLAKIGQERSDEKFFQRILSELLVRFGRSLLIRVGLLYERRGETFELIHQEGGESAFQVASSLPVAEPAVQAVLKHGSYIYDHPSLQAAFGIVSPYPVTPAAITIRIAEREWFFLFLLAHGWIREEILLFLNAVKTALSYRLFSELIDSELNMAAQIQKSLLPMQAPEIPGFDIAHCTQPAESVGGDFYDYFQLDGDVFGVTLGDASGHGLPAALLARDVVIGLRMGLNHNTRVLHTIERLNRVIQRSTYSTNFVSLFIGEIEDSSHLFFVNAGHPPPFLISGKTVRYLEATGIALGFLPDVSWHRSHVPFEEGDVLVIYSDGIVERERSPEEQFGLKRLLKLVMHNRHLPASEIVQCVYQTVYEFGKKRSWTDDATLVVVKRLQGQDEMGTRGPLIKTFLKHLGGSHGKAAD